VYREQLEAHPDAVDVPAALIRSGAVRVAEQDGAIVGFSALLDPGSGACELDALFVEPDWMGTGVGRRLIDDARRIAREHGATRIDVIANPQAVAFYDRLGFTTSGWAETRFGIAPRMSLRLDA